MRAGKIVLGVSRAPVYGELAYAESGAGAYLNGQRISVSDVPPRRGGALVGQLEALGVGPAMAALWAAGGAVNRIRGYGDFLHYHLLAAGKIDAVIESDVNILDIAACSAIVTEAGGRFTELDGSPLTLASRTVLATNGPLHPLVLQALDEGAAFPYERAPAT